MLTQTIGIFRKTRSQTKIHGLIEILIIILLLCFATPFNVNAAQTTKSIYTSQTYTHNSRFDKSIITNGIDISEHNGSINFNSLKKTNTKQIIVRVGCRGYGSKGTLMKDDNFDTNIKNCLANGFDTGVYFYSQALNETEAVEEANFVLKYIKDYEFNLPVYFDYEFAGVSSGRLDKAWNNRNINKSQMTKNTLAFCKTIENAGYKAGVYASKAFYEDNLNASQIDSDYAIWVAHYNTKTPYAGAYQSWQYSAKGKVSGIDGYVDSNYFYYDYLTSFLNNGFEIEDIPDQEFTGSEIKPEIKVCYKEKELIKGEDYYVSYENNTDIGSAVITVTGINGYEEFTKSKKTFSIVPQEIQNLTFKSRGTNSISVSWDKNEQSDDYLIQVHRSAGWINAGTTNNKTSFDITDLATASNYRIRVRAFKTVNGATYSGKFSQEIETATAPSIPSKLASSNVKPDSLKLTWKKQTNANYYKVYKYNGKTSKYEFFRQVDKGVNNFLVINSLKPNTTYKFKVTAHKKSKDGELLNSARSTAFTTYTSPAKPEIISAKSGAKKKITVKWNKLSGVTGYRVMWSTTKDFSSNFKSVYVTGGSTTLSTAQTGKTYYVRVQAYKTRNDKKIYSPWSKTLKTKTK